MLQPGRKYSGGSGYRYGFNGKENDKEVKGDGNQQDYGMRIYDPRAGRFLSTDPLKAKYPSWTPYAYAMNDVIRCIDLDGAEKKVVIHWIDGFYDDGVPKITKTTVEINKTITYVNVYLATGLPVGDGKRYAATETYYILPDGRFIQANTMYEEIAANGLKPSANYDYSKDAMPDKQADDSKYTHQFDDASMPASTLYWWIKASSDIAERDAKATDNASTLEDLGGVNAALIVIGHANLKNGITGDWALEKQSWSKSSVDYQEQITGRRGQQLLVGDVSFDGVNAQGILLDAKAKYENILSYGFAKEGLLKQARKQITAAKGNPIEWHFAEEGAANAVSQLFKDNNITEISVHYTPAIKNP